MGRVYLGRKAGYGGIDNFKAVKLIAPANPLQTGVLAPAR